MELISSARHSHQYYTDQTCLFPSYKEVIYNGHDGKGGNSMNSSHSLYKGVPLLHLYLNHVKSCPVYVPILSPSLKRPWVSRQFCTWSGPRLVRMVPNSVMERSIQVQNWPLELFNRIYHCSSLYTVRIVHVQVMGFSYLCRFRLCMVCATHKWISPSLNSIHCLRFSIYTGLPRSMPNADRCRSILIKLVLRAVWPAS